MDPEYQGLQVERDMDGNFIRNHNRNWALDAVKAADAYERLEARYGAGTLPGAGQRIAVIDTGIDLGLTGLPPHPELVAANAAGRVSYSLILGAEREPYYDADKMAWTFSHGTAVSSLILASRDDPHRDWSFHGIAYGAHLDMYGLTLGTGSGGYDPQPATRAAILGRARARVALLDPALTNPPDVVNMSFGYSEIAEHFLPQRANMEQWLKPLIDQVKGSAGTIFVAAAGNGNERVCERTTDVGCDTGKLQATSPTVISALPLWDRSGDNNVGERWVAVVATDSTGAIADFSNRCGQAAKWCLAAPGADVLIAYTGPYASETPHLLGRGWGRGGGTSYAAPLVSGGLAVVKQYFGDTLTMEQVLQRLYATADVTPDPVAGGGTCPGHLDTDGDRTTCELSSTHGQGLMNLEKATRPVGGTSGGGTFADAGGAIAATLALRGVEPVVFDSLGYPFRVAPRAQAYTLAPEVDPIPGFADEPDPGPRWRGLHWRDAEPDGPARRWSFAGASDATGALVGGGLAYRGGTGARYWKAGFVGERDRVHGGAAAGSWAGGGFWHHTTFLRAGKRWRLAGDADGGVSLEAASTLAHGAMRGNGVLQETNGVYSSHALHLDVGGPDRRTRLTLESPLRAEAGAFTLKVPVGGTLADGVRYAGVDGDLAPEARELRLTGRHEVEGRYGRLAVAAGMRVNAGHRAGEEDWHAGVQWRLRY